MELIKIFKLLLYKNFLVRKRFLIKSAIFGIVLPLLLLLLGLYVRVLRVEPPEYISSVKIYPVETQKDITISVKIKQLYYAPNNEFTTSIINEMNNCLIRNNASIGKN